MMTDRHSKMWMPGGGRRATVATMPLRVSVCVALLTGMAAQGAGRRLASVPWPDRARVFATEERADQMGWSRLRERIVEIAADWRRTRQPYRVGRSSLRLHRAVG